MKGKDVQLVRQTIDVALEQSSLIGGKGKLRVDLRAPEPLGRESQQELSTPFSFPARRMIVA